MSSRRVLIVEDDALERDLLAQTVSSFGIKALTAIDGQDAVETLTTNDVDAIITDL